MVSICKYAALRDIGGLEIDKNEVNEMKLLTDNKYRLVEKIDKIKKSQESL